MYQILVLCLASSYGRRVQLQEADRNSWSRQALSQYLNARAGVANNRHRVWRGRGTVSNTLTGERVADVDFIEKVQRFPAGSRDSDGYRSERVLAYYDKGKLLSKPVHYSHNISHSVDDGHLVLRAVGADEKVVANGRAVGHGLKRFGVGRAFHFSVRPSKGDKIAPKLVPDMEKKTKFPTSLTGKRPSNGILREEYSLEEPLLSRLLGGRGRVLRYKRTGRCPTCCGAGVCTLEVTSILQPMETQVLGNWWSSLFGRRNLDIDEEDVIPSASLDLA